MDVQPLALSVEIPRVPTRSVRAGGAPVRRRSRPRRPRLGGDAAITRRRSWLYAYTGATILAGMGALLWTTLAVPVLPGIDPGLGGTALAGPDGGMLVWIAFGFIGSLRVLPIPGGSGVWTFHLPFIAAAMVLGGPTAGAWVAFLSTIERRELASQPWYGMLANHAVMALAAVMGGLTVLIARGALADAGVEAGLAGLAAIAPARWSWPRRQRDRRGHDHAPRGPVAARAERDPRPLLRRHHAGGGRPRVVFVTLFTTAGWWAPMALAVAVLLAWPREGVEFMDPLTKLRATGFPARAGRRAGPHATRPGARRLLVLFDLDGFGLLNKEHGQHVG